MAVELAPQQRDALFKRILLDFSGFEDLQVSIAAGDLEQAYRLGRRIADGFRLIVDGGLGWEDRTAEPTTISLPPIDLRRIMCRMHDEAVAEWDSKRPDREETEREWGEVTDARDACSAVLAQIAS